MIFVMMRFDSQYCVSLSTQAPGCFLWVTCKCCGKSLLLSNEVLGDYECQYKP